MVDSVKSRRTYDSSRRRQQAAATRREILEAAQRLFERDGYALTSVPAIAGEAGVALKTVYVVFGTKANLLRVLWDERLAGEEAATPVMERGWYREVLEEPDPERQLRLLAAQSGRVKARSGALMEVIRNAAFADSDIASLWNDIEAKLLKVSRSLVKHLETKKALADHLDVNAATDILWTLSHPSLWQLLVCERRWTTVAYERWLYASLRAQLLK